MRAGSKSPSFSSFALRSSNACWSEPLPSGSRTCAESWYSPRGGYTRSVPRASTFIPSRGLNLTSRASRPPHDRADLRALVLEREVPVAGRRHLEVRDLALHPHVEELRLEDALDALGQLGDGERPRARRAGLGRVPEVEALLPHSGAVILIWAAAPRPPRSAAGGGRYDDPVDVAFFGSSHENAVAVPLLRDDGARGRARSLPLLGPAGGPLAGAVAGRAGAGRGAAQAVDRAAAEPAGLDAEERHTIALFKDVSRSVAFITTQVEQVDLWTRSVAEVPAGTGSGFVWDAQGHVVTNFHVVQSGETAKVTVGVNEYPAKLVGYSREQDLAVLRIDAARAKLVPIRVGTSADAAGRPEGLRDRQPVRPRLLADQGHRERPRPDDRERREHARSST